MGLESVISCLEQAGLRARTGWPAGGAMAVGGTVAAVNLTAVDSGQGTAGITVTVLTPRSQGLSHCQQQAAAAVAALSGGGQGWSFDGWSYDSREDCFRIELRSVTGVALENGTWTPEGELRVLIGEEEQSRVTEFTAGQQKNRRLIRASCQAEPVGVTPGVGGWVIRLVQWLPAGMAEPKSVEEPFVLTVRRGGRSQVFSGCCWSDYRAEHRAGGTRVVREGFALSREVNADGADAV